MVARTANCKPSGGRSSASQVPEGLPSKGAAHQWGPTIGAWLTHAPAAPGAARGAHTCVRAHAWATSKVDGDDVLVAAVVARVHDQGLVCQAEGSIEA